jgi:serine/threonine-protein kinase
MRVCTKCGRSSDIAVDTCPACRGALITATDVRTDGSAALAIDPSEELEAGTMVGDYRIERRIGYGGMGIVYGAVHPVIGKRAAIKVLNAKYCADRESLTRFLGEAQAVNKIAHTNIVDIFSIGQLDDGRSYLVMEWLQGETLMDRIERDPLKIEDTITILIALTRGLEAAHNAGVIHRDLKPENVFLIPEDDSFRVKLLDFGIAKLQTTRAPTRKTATGMTVGTPLYMSPEQAKGNAIDGRTDIYSLGILAYAMVCRTTPFENEASPVEVLHAHISKPPRPPHEIYADVPPALETLILQMLAKNADERPSIPEVRQRLKALTLDAGGFETFSAVTPMPARPSMRPPAPKRRLLLRWSLALLVIAAGAGVFAFVFMHGTKPKPIVETPSPTPTPAPSASPEPSPIQPTMGTIELSVDPAAATVTVDGKPITLDAGHARIAIELGEHKLATTATGYRAVEQSVAVTSTDVTPVSVKLAKATGRTGRKRPGDVDAVVNPFGKKKTK